MNFLSKFKKPIQGHTLSSREAPGLLGMIGANWSPTSRTINIENLTNAKLPQLNRLGYASVLPVLSDKRTVKQRYQAEADILTDALKTSTPEEWSTHYAERAAKLRKQLDERYVKTHNTLHNREQKLLQGLYDIAESKPRQWTELTGIKTPGRAMLAAGILGGVAGAAVGAGVDKLQQLS